MRFEGIHHITLITGDAPRNVDFYTRVLGQRLVKKTVNQDDPTVYHLFYADEHGSPGADITFFEYPGARRGRPGAGMVHTIVYRVGSEDALDFWAERLQDEGVRVDRPAGRVSFSDPEGVALELAVVADRRRPARRRAPRDPGATSRSRASTAFVPSPPTSSAAARFSRARSASSRAAMRSGRSAAGSAAGSSASTPRRPSVASAARAPSTTSRGRRRRPSRRRGARGWRRRACSRRR